MKDNFCEMINDIPIYELYNKSTALSKENINTFSLYINKYMEMQQGKKNINRFYKFIYNKRVPLINVNINKIQIKSIIKCLKDRTSCRNFSTDRVTFEEVSMILKYSCGVNRIDNNENFYTYPISGGIDSLNYVVVINNVENVDNGVYLYDTIDNELILLFENFELEEYEKITGSYYFANKSCFSIHILGDTSKKCQKYQDRGYRFLLIEVGHVAQNMCLLSEGIGVSTLVSGGFLDYDFLEFIKMKIGYLEFFNNNILIYEIFFGKS